MPRPPKGPRLYLRRGRSDSRTGRALPDTYFIRDGQVQVGTGCGPDRLSEAEGCLARYLAEKWRPTSGGRAGQPSDPGDVLVAEVLAYYAKERAPELARPSDAGFRITTLLAGWGDCSLADVRPSSCKAYVAARTSQRLRRAKYGEAARPCVDPQTARRELEDLSAAIAFWDKEYPLTARPSLWYPPKPESPRDALTRADAAKLLKAALGWRWEAAEGRWRRLSPSACANRNHVRRFILTGLYTGTRPGVIPKILWQMSATQAWADLEEGMIYRRGKLEREHRTKRRPVVRLPNRLLAHMRRWKAMDAKAAVVSKKPLGTVVHHGGRAISGRLRRAFDSCVSDAGLDAEISPHWMRHTCATWLMQARVDLWEAAAFTGMTVATLEKCYGHHRPDHQAAARKALG